MWKNLINLQVLDLNIANCMSQYFYTWNGDKIAKHSHGTVKNALIMQQKLKHKTLLAMPSACMKN